MAVTRAASGDETGNSIGLVGTFVDCSVWRGSNRQLAKKNRLSKKTIEIAIIFLVILIVFLSPYNPLIISNILWFDA